MVSTLAESGKFKRAEEAHHPGDKPQFWGSENLQVSSSLARFPRLLQRHGLDVSIQTIAPIKELLFSTTIRPADRISVDDCG